jgi:DNA-binding PadR family transcriptional regulator
VSPVFRHGRLRLYLLKLLDEAPRHGYEVIRLLQDRFLGVYAPSPGTIYPRLARLEEDGLVTHEEVDGKKVYSITDKGREEIRGRLGELADLEDELTESLRDVAREISEDVRDTVRSIREELASAAREFRNSEGSRPGRDTPAPGEDEQPPGEQDEAPPGEQDEAARRARGRDRGSDEAQRIRAEARRAREQMRASFREQGRGRGDWAAWQERHGRPDWASWASWSDWVSGSGDFSGSGKSGPGAGQASATDTGSGDAGSATASSGAEPGRPGGGGQRPWRGGASPFSDLERIAIQFATELRAAAKQTGNLGERSLNDLRDILTDTLAKVRAEVFADAGPAGEAGDSPAGKADAGPAGKAGDSPEAGPPGSGEAPDPPPTGQPGDGQPSS